MIPALLYLSSDVYVLRSIRAVLLDFPHQLNGDSLRLRSLDQREGGSFGLGECAIVYEYLDLPALNAPPRVCM